MQNEKTKTMDNVEWHPFFYNGLETNIEVTICGRVRRVFKDWMELYRKSKEVDFSRFKESSKKFSYRSINFIYKGYNGNRKTLFVHTIVACVFLNHSADAYNKNKIVIDHIDSNRYNNHADNLRIVTNRENLSKERTIKSGLPTGVTYHKRIKAYEASISVKKKRYYLGVYNSAEEASQVYQNALEELNKFLKDADDKISVHEWYLSYYQKIKKIKPRTYGLPVGVFYHKKNRNYSAIMIIKKQNIHLGQFYNIEDASETYQEALKILSVIGDKNVLEKNTPEWRKELRKKIKNNIEQRSSVKVNKHEKA